jgi:membrane-bound metal-dependent hydrolase YbcI (DUF457 family)
MSRRLVTVTAVAAMVPDVDAIGRPFGAGDIGFLGGHRAVTHSIFFAVGIAALLASLWRGEASRKRRGMIFVYVLAVMSSHGILDAFTRYGEGVAFLAPLSMVRWKSPWQPFSGILVETIILWLPSGTRAHSWSRCRFDILST